MYTYYALYILSRRVATCTYTTQCTYCQGVQLPVHILRGVHIIKASQLPVHIIRGVHIVKARSYLYIYYAVYILSRRVATCTYTTRCTYYQGVVATCTHTTQCTYCQGAQLPVYIIRGVYIVKARSYMYTYYAVYILSRRVAICTHTTQCRYCQGAQLPVHILRSVHIVKLKKGIF